MSAAADFAHHAGEARLAQAFLHRLQDGVRFAGLGVDHLVGMQADGGQAWGKQVGVFLHPQHRAALAGQDAGDEQRRDGAILGVGPAPAASCSAPRGRPPAGRTASIDGCSKSARPRGRAATCSMRAMRARRVSIDLAGSRLSGGTLAAGGLGIDRSICSPG